MQVTEIKVDLAEKGDPYLASVSVTLNQTVVLGGIYLYENPKENEYFLLYPAVRDRCGRYHEIILPVSAELKEDICRRAVLEYLSKMKTNDSPPPGIKAESNAIRDAP